MRRVVTRRIALTSTLLVGALGSALAEETLAVRSADGAAVDSVIELIRSTPEGDPTARGRTVSRLGELPEDRRYALLEAFDHLRLNPDDAPALDLLADVFRSFRSTERMQLLRPREGSAAGDRDRLRALLIARDIELEDGLDVLLEIAADTPEEQARHPLYRQSLELAYRSILSRDRTAPGRLARAIPDQPSTLREPALNALDLHVGSAQLSELLGADLDLNRGVLRRLANHRFVPPDALHHSATTNIRWCLVDGDAESTRLAIIVIGRYHLVELASELTSRLGARERGVGVAAHKALQQLTGRTLGPREELWTRWLEAEALWQERSAASTKDAALDRDPDIAVEAIQRIARRRLARAELVDTLAVAAEHESPRVRMTACWALGVLGDPRSVRDLEELLEDEAAAVRRAASTAIAAITGLPEPSDPRTWAGVEALSLFR